MLASLVDRIIKRRPASGALLQDDLAQRVEVTRKSLNHFWLIVHGHEERLILITPDHVIEEIDRRLLLKLKPVADAIRSIEQQAYPQRHVRLPVEEAHLLLRVIIEDPKIVAV